MLLAVVIVDLSNKAQYERYIHEKQTTMLCSAVLA